MGEGREILETRSLQEDGGPESGWKLCPNPWVTAKRHPCTKRPEGAQQKNRPMGERVCPSKTQGHWVVRVRFLLFSCVHSPTPAQPGWQRAEALLAWVSGGRGWGRQGSWEIRHQPPNEGAAGGVSLCSDLWRRIRGTTTTATTKRGDPKIND